MRARRRSPMPRRERAHRCIDPPRRAYDNADARKYWRPPCRSVDIAARPSRCSPPMTRCGRVATVIGAVLGAIVLAMSTAAYAQDDASAPSQPIVTLVAVSALAIVPFVFMTTTSFVKISVVFSILRNALGTGQVPSGTVIAALAAILTLYVMAPVGSQIVDEAGPAATRIDPNNPLADLDALGAAIEAGVRPLKAFL